MSVQLLSSRAVAIILRTAEALRVRGRAFLAHPALDLIVAADAWNETEHELRKRMVLLVERNVRDCSAVGERCGCCTLCRRSTGGAAA